MNWEALGAIAELLGSIAVILTLLYLVRQLKSTETATINSAQSAIQTTRATVDAHRIEYLPVILKANAGEEISPLEKEQLKGIYTLEQRTMFFTYMNFKRLGGDGKIQAFNFARYLFMNPSMIDLWEEDIKEWPSMNKSTDEWREHVEESFSKIKAEKGGT